MNSTKSIEDIKSRIPNSTPQEVLGYWAEHFQGRVKFSTSFGKEDQALTHMISTGHYPVEIFTLDTGRLFPATYELYQRTVKKYAVSIQVYFPDSLEVEQMVNTKGPNSFYDSVENRKECCRIRKVQPLRRALADADVWITGLMPDQSENRQLTPLVEYDSFFNVIKCNPLSLWSRNELDQYLATHRIPVNPLHAQGFESIGCAPCTRAISAGEHPRAGRWWWEQSHKECGIHTVNNQ